MRTTLTLDPDVARLLQDAMHKERRSMKAVVNDALRRGLSGDKKAQPYEPKTRHSALQPGIDPGRLNQLADELADEDLIEGWANARS